MNDIKTRRDAIDHILGLSGSVANEYCVGPHEVQELDAETRTALLLLGATEQEIDWEDES